MNIASLAFRSKAFVWFLTVILIGAGLMAYGKLGKLEDPAFTIKTAVVMTPYPGASPREVEEEVTEVVESAIQQMGQVDKVRSLSQAGMSMIYVDIKDHFTAPDLPQIWNELRQKVGDMQRSLPPGAGPSLVNDDYGDVFGIYYALTGPGYTLRELGSFADDLRKELLLVPGVARVQIGHRRQEAVYVEISRTKLAQLGISLQEIAGAIQNENLVVSSGMVEVGKEYLRIDPTGIFTAVEQIGDLILRSSGGTLIRLRDVASVRREYVPHPSSLMFYNGTPAMDIGISCVEGGNVILLGEEVEKRLQSFASHTPLGMELHPIYFQPGTVQTSIDVFMENLAEAVAIVVALLLVFMGLRSGLLIGAILVLTILATFVVMKAFAIDLHSISLGAMVIALGMLVDAAIVVVDGILIGSQMGKTREDAAKGIVGQTQWPLLGATVIAIIAFAPVGLSPDSTGEYCKSLFQVVGISLLLSWVLAVTITPLAGAAFLRTPPLPEGENPFGSPTYQKYRELLEFCLTHRPITLIALGGMLALAAVGFTHVAPGFFPSDTSPMFTVDFWRPRGSSLAQTRQDAERMEAFLLRQEEAPSVASYVGEGAMRFLLTFTPADPGNHYGSFVVSTHTGEEGTSLMKKITDFAAREMPGLDPRVRSFGKGTGSGAKIQVRVQGEDPDALRKTAERISAILLSDSRAINVRSDWGERTKVLRPVLDEVRARTSGLTRRDVAQALEMAFSGTTTGIYRDGDKLLPIVARLPREDRSDAGTLPTVSVWSAALRTYLPLSQVVRAFDNVAEDQTIYRRNRVRTITVECDAGDGKTAALFDTLRPQVEALPLPSGQSLEWGGEFESSTRAKAGLMGMIPLGFLFIVIILVALFNSYRQPILILLTLPLSIIGVTAGLLMFNKPFDFLALLGFLSLAGMLIRNAIVLIDQIDLEIHEGKPPFQAVVESAMSRARPVLMGAFTTVLGMVPLYFDVLYSAMAVVIMFGLTFATVLTLVVVPVFYAVIFRIPAKS